MKTATAPLLAFLNSGAMRAVQFDFWTIALASGTVVKWTDADIDLAGFVRGPGITRDQVRWVRGIEVDQLKATLAGPGLTVDGQLLPAFAAAGGFDGAWVLLERAFLDDTLTLQGKLSWFAGQVADVTPGRMGCELVVKSQLTQLSQQLPRNLYQPSCLNDLYDSNCAASRAANTYAGTVATVYAGYNPALGITFGAPVGDQVFPLGTLKFTSGKNAGLSRTVQAQSGPGQTVVFTFSRPFPFAVGVGDAVSLTAGCDKTMPTCAQRFNNLGHFRGQPFIPAPETIT